MNSFGFKNVQAVRQVKPFCFTSKRIIVQIKIFGIDQFADKMLINFLTVSSDFCADEHENLLEN